MQDTFGRTPPPLASVTSEHIGTAAAAFYLNRATQTLRHWACKGTGPVQPKNVGGRLMWPVAAIRKELGVEVSV